MRRLFPLLVSLSLVVGLGFSTRADAQRPRISYKVRQQAKRLFGQGRHAYRMGKYETAISKWQESYELSREPLIFESIAAAYERLNDPKNAYLYLEKWRRKAPRRDHAPLDERIESLKERIAKLDRDEQAQREAEARLAEADEARKIREKREDLEQRGRLEERGFHRVVGYSALGVGAAASIAGAVLGGVGAGVRPNETEACTRSSDGALLCRSTFTQDIEQSNSLAIAGDATWIAGAAIMAGGAVWLLTKGQWLDDEAMDSGPTAVIVPLVLPRVGANFAGLQIQGHF